MAKISVIQPMAETAQVGIDYFHCQKAHCNNHGESVYAKTIFAMPDVKAANKHAHDKCGSSYHVGEKACSKLDAVVSDRMARHKFTKWLGLAWYHCVEKA